MGEEFSPSRCVRDAHPSYSVPPRSWGPTYRPAWGAGTLSRDVVAGAPILARAAQLTVSPMAPRWAQLLTAAWGSRGVRHGSSQSEGRAPGPQGFLGISELSV